MSQLLFEDLISPVEPERFFAEYWESRYLLVERRDPGYYGRLFTLEDVDRAIQVARSSPSEALTLGPPRGVDKPRRTAAAAKMSREEIYGAFCEGFSLRFMGVHRFWPSLASLQSALSERLSARISIELYLTPAETQGVIPHYDNRDVFVLQVHGSKRWILGKPVYELPGIGLGHVGDRVPGQVIDNDSPLLTEDVVVRAGDLLYLPRGFYHKPIAEDETSLHLSVVINPVSWSDFLARAVEQAAQRRPSLRASLPPGFMTDPEVRAGMAATFAEQVREFVREAPFEDVLDAITKEV